MSIIREETRGKCCFCSDLTDNEFIFHTLRKGNTLHICDVCINNILMQMNMTTNGFINAIMKISDMTVRELITETSKIRENN